MDAHLKASLTLSRKEVDVQPLTDAVIRIFNERYACQEIPNGEMTVIAKEVGCTRALVSKIAKDYGFVSTRVAQRKGCYQCGKMRPDLPSNPASDYCSNCKKIEIACTWCGKLNKYSRAAYIHTVSGKRKAGSILNKNGKIQKLEYTGRKFCNRVCFGKWAGSTYGVGPQRARKKAAMVERQTR